MHFEVDWDSWADSFLRQLLDQTQQKGYAEEGLLPGILLELG